MRAEDGLRERGRARAPAACPRTSRSPRARPRARRRARRSAGAKTMSVITSSAVSRCVVGDARVDDRVLARGGGVQLAAEARRRSPRSPARCSGREPLKSRCSMKCETPALRVRLVARAGADPEAERDRAHVREALRDHALAGVELREDVLLLHGRDRTERSAAPLRGRRGLGGGGGRDAAGRPARGGVERGARGRGRAAGGRAAAGLAEASRSRPARAATPARRRTRSRSTAGPLERLYGRDPELLQRQIRRVVLHEIAHHFGISDERLVQLDRCSLALQSLVDRRGRLVHARDQPGRDDRRGPEPFET